MLVTISREYGAGGSSVAKRVATALDWKLVDNQLVEEVAKRAGMTADEVSEKQERGPTFVERLARALTVATPEVLGASTAELPEQEEARLVHLTEQVVAEAAHGDAVLVGRAAVAVVGMRADIIHVKLVGSAAHRATLIAERLAIPLDEAERRVRDVDAHRARYHRQYYDRDWHDPHNYHLTINTEWMGFEKAAALIVAVVQGEQRGANSDLR
ncbi:MAG: cytidylate kinase-like family protein [Gemmatimonadales bacterium]|nr:cytidylate kinase-like family protein [Gemmatimonadales bacterium]